MSKPRSNCQRSLLVRHMARPRTGASTTVVPKACTA